jgi:hypothetical protein
LVGGAALVVVVGAAGFFLEGLVVGLGALLVGAGPGRAVVVFAVGLLVAAEAAELVEEGARAGLEAVLVGEEAGQGGGLVLGEVGGEDLGGGVAGVVEPGVEGDVGGVGFGRGVIERRVEQAVFDPREVLELPEGQGELVDQGVLGGGGGAVFLAELDEGGGVLESGGGVGDGEVSRRGGGGQAVGTGVLGGAAFALRGAGAGGVLGVAAVAVRLRGVESTWSYERRWGSGCTVLPTVPGWGGRR